MSEQRQVGCERDDGLLNVHPETETCEVCAMTDHQSDVEARSPEAIDLKWLDEIEAQADSTCPYYLPRLIAECRTLASVLAQTRQENASLKASAREVAEINNPVLLQQMDQAVRIVELEAELAASLRAREALEQDARQRADENAKLISEVLHERDKLEVMAQRADRFFARAEAAEASLRALEQEREQARVAMLEFITKGGDFTEGWHLADAIRELRSQLASARRSSDQWQHNSEWHFRRARSLEQERDRYKEALESIANAWEQFPYGDKVRVGMIQRMRRVAGQALASPQSAERKEP